MLLPDLPLDTFSTISLGPLASGTREGRRAGAGRRRENPAGAKRGRREGLRRGDLPPFPPLSTGPERNKQRAKASGKRGDVPAGSRGSGGSSPSRPSRPPAAQAVAAGGGGRGGGHRHRGISAALRASGGVCRLRSTARLGVYPKSRLGGFYPLPHWRMSPCQRGAQLGELRGSWEARRCVAAGAVSSLARVPP